MNTAQCAMNWTGDTSQQQSISIIQMKKQIKHEKKFKQCKSWYTK